MNWCSVTRARIIVMAALFPCLPELLSMTQPVIRLLYLTEGAITFAISFRVAVGTTGDAGVLDRSGLFQPQ